MGVETLCFMLWEEHILRVFENNVLRRIFGPKRNEVTGDWRKLHTLELHNLYTTKYYDNQTKEVTRGGAFSTHRWMRNACNILTGKPEGKNRPLARHTQVQLGG
jgi:hypothetical protein